MFCQYQYSRHCHWNDVAKMRVRACTCVCACECSTSVNFILGGPHVCSDTRGNPKPRCGNPRGMQDGTGSKTVLTKLRDPRGTGPQTRRAPLTQCTNPERNTCPSPWTNRLSNPQGKAGPLQWPLKTGFQNWSYSSRRLTSSEPITTVSYYRQCPPLVSLVVC